MTWTELVVENVEFSENAVLIDQQATEPLANSKEELRVTAPDVKSDNITTVTTAMPLRRYEQPCTL